MTRAGAERTTASRAAKEMRAKNAELQARADELHARIRRLRRWVMLLVATSLAIGVPATFLWGKGGHAMFGDAQRTSNTVVLLGLGAGACAIVAALLALRIVRLSDSLPRGR